MSKKKKNKKLKVLLIEDDNYVSQLYQDIISFDTDWELEVISSLTDLEKDFEKIKKTKPDVILLDLILPALPKSKKDGGYILDKELGFQILERIKKDKKTKKIPVIVISALSSEADKDRAKALGAEKYLVKSEILPFQIIEAVNEVLGL